MSTTIMEQLSLLGLIKASQQDMRRKLQERKPKTEREQLHEHRENCRGSARYIVREAEFEHAGKRWRLRTQGDVAVIHEWRERLLDDETHKLLDGEEEDPPGWASYASAYFTGTDLIEPTACQVSVDERAQLGFVTVDVSEDLLLAARREIPNLQRYFRE